MPQNQVISYFLVLLIRRNFFDVTKCFQLKTEIKIKIAETTPRIRIEEYYFGSYL